MSTRRPSAGQIEKAKAPPKQPVNDEEIRIIVMGRSGAGKSSFINLASNSTLRVGSSLESCTESVELSEPFELQGRRIRLIDTPGFDDSSKSDAEVLNTIATFLANEWVPFDNDDRSKLMARIFQIQEWTEIERIDLFSSHFRCANGSHFEAEFRDVPKALWFRRIGQCRARDNTME